MKPSESAQVEFIKDCLRQGQKRNVILGKFGKKWEKVSRTTFDRRLRQATDALGNELEQIQRRTEEGVTKEIEERKLKVLSVAEKVDLLARIALGEIKIPTKEAKWDSEQRKFVMIPFEELASHTARIAAIKELNEMCGDHAPVRQDITINDAPDVIAPGKKKD